jgi:hypothetical protein
MQPNKFQQLERSKNLETLLKNPTPKQLKKKKRKQKDNFQINKQMKKILMMSKTTIENGKESCACEQVEEKDGERGAEEFVFVVVWRLAT